MTAGTAGGGWVLQQAGLLDQYFVDYPTEKSPAEHNEVLRESQARMEEVEGGRSLRGKLPRQAGRPFPDDSQR